MKRKREPSESKAMAITSVMGIQAMGLQPLLTIHDLAVIYRVSVPTIRRGLQTGTWRPVPWDKYPYRWRKDDVDRDLAANRPELRMRNHGRYGPHKLRTAKVDSPSGRNGHPKRAAGGRARK